MNTDTATILKEIQLLVNIQKTHPQWHPEWQKASERLAPRFAEMARRKKAGDPLAISALIG